MPLTRGNLYTTKKEYHIFTTDDIGLNNLGLNSYNFSSIVHLKESLPNIDKKNQNQNQGPSTTTTINPATNPIINEVGAYFNSPVEVFNSLICSGSYAENPKIMHFDKNILAYVEQQEPQILSLTEECGESTGPLPTNIGKFLKAYNEALLYKDDITSDGYQKLDIIKIAQKIQNSLSGCITFSIKYTALGCERIVPIKLRLLDKENADDRRIIATKGAPIIAGIPREITGREYSFSGTSEASIGVSQNPYEGGVDNPKNTVAGQLDIRYNKTTGKWQSGTHQILARLITDVDSAQIGSINPAISGNIGSYNVGSDSWVGQFTTGSGIPLSMEKGNPYMYGPNYIGCPSGPRDIEKIRVVNRSNRIFKNGDVVLASNIDGEWIIQGFDLPTTAKKSLAGQWQFQKFIVNSDSFFKDARFLSTNPRNSSPSQFIQNISPDIYETKMRKKYYSQVLSAEPRLTTYAFADSNLICKMNLYLDKTPEEAAMKTLPPTSEYDILLSSGYYQSSAFDQLGPSLGGINPRGNIIGRTSIYTSPSGSVADEYGTVYQNNIPHFWGPAFPNGYTSKSVGSLINKKNDSTSFIAIDNLNEHKFLQNQGKINFDASSDAINVGMFADTQDFNFLQLPAEVGLNGPPNSGLSSNIDKFSAPIERINIISSDQSKLPLYFYNKVSGGEKGRYSYLSYKDSANNIAYSGLFDLKPINPGYIQFSPLQLHTALSSHNITNPFKFEYINLKTEIEAGKSAQIYKTDYSSNNLLIFPQSFMSRNNLKIESEINFLNVQPKIGTGPFEFGPYVSFPEFNPSPVGGPQIIPKELFLYEKSNLIGIIAAKNNFTAGSQINLTTTQTFGLPKKVTVGTGGNVLVTVLGAFLAWSDANIPASQRGDPQWGDRTRTDAPDSFGTTALHVRIFDEWPDNQTFYDGRYFAVLHFNPAVGSNDVPSEYELEKLRCAYGSSFVGATRRNTVLIAQIRVQEYGTILEKHIFETSVDFTEPTTKEGNLIAVNSIVNNSTQLLPTDYWIINPVRRGALLTGGGFRYARKVIGLNKLSLKVKQDPSNNRPMVGSGYEEGDIIDFPKGAKAKVIKIEAGGKIKNVELIEQGLGFLPEDFPVLSSGGGSGSGAVLECESGIVYYKYDIDLGPRERCPTRRLSKPSDSGNGIATGIVRNSIPLDGNGKYDAFYFMHNDILHTLLFQTPFTAGLAQHITLEIG